MPTTQFSLTPAVVLKVVCILAAAAMLIPTFFLTLSLSFGSPTYASKSLWMLPWVLGLYGVLGIASTLQRATKKSSIRLRLEAMLLVMGILGALLFMAVLLVVLVNSVVPWQIDWGLLTLILVLAVPTLAILLAVREIQHARLQWQTNSEMNARSRRGLLLFVLISPLLCCGIRVAIQEAAMAWYGRDLQGRAEAAAMRIAGASPFCVFDAHHPITFSSLDARQILLTAFENRFGFRRDFRDPHFGIRIAEKNYWWSFRQNTFVELPRIEFTYPRRCAME